MEPLVRLAAPTAATPVADTGSSEGRADPHGIHWTRGAPPVDAHLYASGDFPTHSDMVAESTARGTSGRRASGFRVPAADPGGSLVFVTGSGKTETWALAAGEGDAVEIASITSWSGQNIRVYW